MIQGIISVCCAAIRVHAQIQSRNLTVCVRDEWRKRRNVIFDNERERQKADVGRIEKISVKYIKPSGEEEVNMMMNKDLSTPTDCALHDSEFAMKTGALSLVDGIPWDMHKPLSNDCKLEVLTMQMIKKSSSLNFAFWRTCSLILGATIDSSFKDDIILYLHSFTWPNVRSGSFLCDAIIDVNNWKPTEAELRALSAQFVKFTRQSLPVERLVVKEEIALDMYQENPFKSQQIPNIAKSQEGNVTLYRIGEHIDISRGPMVGHTGIVGKATITAVHKLESEEENRYRFQGIALPSGVFLNHFAYGILEERARQLNKTTWMPQKQFEDTDESANTVVAQIAQN
ncbi:PREDICTED: 39S ribosomal protein L39, mitochondrial [Ceratosolen solmsi marchali]|uniref:39S ribosomal protein L39, mitochondrial n=1 Tax=Ceratosolen solmsi marchali TaxID=326594 RepID=A0AAJ6YEC9_9HYME|nr:PREDICTED: 39S ribosomal protein L39, mitochondrial [Ceratosolen solmsi marchali]